MELNKEIPRYSSETEEQSAFQNLALAIYELGEILINSGLGSTAEISGHTYWVSPLNNQLHVFFSPDVGDGKVSNWNVFTVGNIEGLSADDLNGVKNEALTWSKAPLIVNRSQAKLDAAVAHWFER